jgi:hypothetical protein
MIKRTLFWVLVTAILGAVVAVTARSSHAAPAVDDCLGKPNALPPQGSHWYYRIDRANNRRCWYLGPQGEKTNQIAPPKQRPSTPRAKAEPSVKPITGANGPMSAVRTAIPAIERKPPLASNSDADEPSETQPEDEMPLIWPVLTAADLAAAAPPTVTETQPQDEMPLVWPVLSTADLAAAKPSTVKSEHMLGLAAVALALAAIIIRKIFKLFTIRRLRRRRHDLRVQWDGRENSSGPRKPVAPTTAAAAHLVAAIHKPPAAPRPVKFPRKPATRRNLSYDFDNHAIEDPEIEESLQRLLRTWRREAA